MKRNLKHPISVLGLPLDSLTATGAVEAIDGLILSGGTHQIATANLDFWLNSLADPHLHRIIAGCSLVLTDGMPLIWVSQLLGCPLAERVTAHLQERFPGVNIVGTYAPPEEEMAQEDHSGLLARIHAARPEILLVALGNPKQEKWIWSYRERLGVPVAMGVGGSFEIMVGDMRRAPRWIQACGLEWAMRFLQEPARLGPRYFRDFMGLGRKLPATLFAAWVQRPYLGESHVTTVTSAQVMHLYLHGKLSAKTAPALAEAAEAAVARGLTMIVHFNAVRHITASGLGALMDLRRHVTNAGLTLSLAGISFSKRFLLRAWCAQPLFDEWESAVSYARKAVKSVDAASGIDLQREQEILPAQTRARG
jgi:N-acetylglucosaminyldiphosphoundecaprenol N-acetyl-beta-D-mannosaminyltransferase